MLIVESDIFAAGLVSPVDGENLKNSTFDLTIGEIFPMEAAHLSDWPGNSPLDSFYLRPQHMVNVTSLQRLKLPDNVTGIATLVTTLTSKGILCLNVGVIDPGYDGRLSATLVNFSNRDRKIEIGDRLFRVLFFKHAAIKNLKPAKIENIDHSRKVWHRSRDEYYETFLNVKGIHEEARKEAWSIVFSTFLTKYFPVLISIFSLFVALIGVYFSYASSE